MLWGRCGFCNERIYQFDLIFTFALRAGEGGGGGGNANLFLLFARPQRLKKDLFSEKERIGSGLCVWNILHKRLALRGIGRMLVFVVLVLVSILDVVGQFCLE